MDLDGMTSLPSLEGAAAIGRLYDGRQEVHIFNGAPVSSRFRIASLTKTFTCVATLGAARAQSVSLDTPLIEILAQLAPYWAADPSITIRHVLAQTSGLAPHAGGADIAVLPDDDEAIRGAARLAVACGSVRPPGRQWEYYNGNYFLAGAVIEQLTGLSYEAALHKLVLAPYGLTTTGFLADISLVPGVVAATTLKEGRYPRGRRPSGGLISTADDLLRFAGHLISDEQLISELATPQTSQQDPMRYGLGWAIGPSGQMYLNGRLPGYRAAMLVLPEQALATVALAAHDDALPAIAGWLSDSQRPLTSDDLANAINDFAA